MPIEASIPTIIPAQDEKVFDKFWLSILRVDAPKPWEAVKVFAELRKCRSVGQGMDMSHVDKSVHFFIDDLFAEMANDPEIATIMGLLLAKVQQMAAARGLI